MTGQVDFRVLGALEVHAGGRRLTLGRPQGRALLALLLLRANNVCPVPRLIADLWGDKRPPSARAQVHNHVSALRRALVAAGAPAALDSRPGGYLLTVDPADLDLERFRRDVAHGRASWSQGDVPAAAAALRAALDHWRGPALCDITVPVVRDFAAGLDQLRVDALEDWAETALAAGRHGDVVDELVRAVAAHPLRERLRALLIRVLTATGRVSEALQVYRTGHATLVAELGIDPGADLREAHAAALRGDAGDRAGTAVGWPVMSLPADLDDFTGRSAAVADGVQLLARRHPRRALVVGISGPAGVGKTSLAIHLAHRVQQAYPDGRALIELDGVATDPAARAGPALTGCLRALGMASVAIPDDIDDRTQVLRTRLRDRALLFVVDGVTHEGQVRPLLELAPRCGFVLTSRRRLDGLDGVMHRELAPLPDNEAVAMLRRVVGARVDADPVRAAEMARHCGGLPIALRVAAARLVARPQWTVADLADRLADEHTRLDWLEAGDRAVRACLDTAYTQLDDDCRRLFGRLGLLTMPTFPSWVAGALLAAPPGISERLLDTLVDGRLVELDGRRGTGPRYRMHELVRLYARERAVTEDDADERTAALRRMCDGWLTLAEHVDAAAPGKLALDPGPPARWSPPDGTVSAACAVPHQWREDEHGSLMATVRLAADHGWSGAAWPLAQRVVSHCDVANRLDDWFATVRVALDVCEAAADQRGIACMARHLAEAHAFAGRQDAVLAETDRATRAYASFDPGWGLATLGPRVAFAHRVRGHTAQARTRAEEAVAAARTIGDPLVAARALNCLAVLARDSDDFAAATELVDEAHAAFVAAGSRPGAAETLGLSGEIARKAGDFGLAEQRLNQAIREGEDLGDEGLAALAVTYLARVRLDRGLPRDAAILAARAVQALQRIGDRYGEAMARDLAGRATYRAHGPAAAIAPLSQAVAAWEVLNAPSQLRDATAFLADARVAAGLADKQ